MTASPSTACNRALLSTWTAPALHAVATGAQEFVKDVKAFWKGFTTDRECKPRSVASTDWVPIRNEVSGQGLAALPLLLTPLSGRGEPWLGYRLVTGMAALGLVGALALYVVTVYMISWSSRREVAAGSRRADGHTRTLVTYPSPREIAGRQGLLWTAFLCVAFLVLSLINVSLSQQLLFAAVFAGFFAFIWLGRAQSKRPDTVNGSWRLNARVARRWSLVWLDGFSFMALLCFTIELIRRLIG